MDESDTDETDTMSVKGLSEDVSKLRSSRSAKLSHVTRRLRIVNSLMVDKDYLEEVKGNMIKFNELLKDFKALHETYVEKLEEEDKNEDVRTWYEPRMVQINNFLSDVSKWIATVENPDSVNLPVDSSEVNSCVQPKVSEDCDRSSVCSKSSKGSSRLSSRSTSSLRIQEEAKRAALLAKAATLQKKHELEEHQELLRKRLEALEIQGELEAATAKITYLKNAEEATSNLQSGTREDVCVQFDDMDDVLHSVDKGAADVKLKEGVGVPPFKNLTKSLVQVKSEQHKHQVALHTATDQRKLSDITLPAVTSQQSAVLPASASQQPYSFNTDQDNNVAKVIENQNELTKILVKQHSLSTLPKVDIPVFDGEIMQYKSFVHSFENMVERKTENNQDRLQLLIQYTRGPAQKLVKSCEYICPSKGYEPVVLLCQIWIIWRSSILA
ncbi:MAG: hypothetical protein ACRC2N_09475 [Aeromonas sp.]